MKFYISTSEENRDMYMYLESLLLQAGHRQALNWFNLCEKLKVKLDVGNHNEETANAELLMRGQIAGARCESVAKSDIMIMISPFGFDSGVEYGVAMQCNVPIIIWCASPLLLPATDFIINPNVNLIVSTNMNTIWMAMKEIKSKNFSKKVLH